MEEWRDFPEKNGTNILCPAPPPTHNLVGLYILRPPGARTTFLT